MKMNGLIPEKEAKENKMKMSDFSLKHKKKKKKRINVDSMSSLQYCRDIL